MRLTGKRLGQAAEPGLLHLRFSAAECRNSSVIITVVTAAEQHRSIPDTP
ncbi:MAG: hypothetical protein IJ874_01025 [Ruminococcus sp.]|nr:hypothetical protein [Ruminococcus sp.]